MIEGIRPSASESVSNLPRSEGVGGASFGSGGQQQSARGSQPVSFGDVLNLSAQARAQAQAAQYYQAQSSRGQRPDIEGLIRQAQAEYQQAQQRGYGQYRAAQQGRGEQSASTARNHGAAAYAYLHSQSTPQAVEGFLNSQLPQAAQPQRAAATYRAMQSRGMHPTGLAPMGTGISLTV